MAESFEMSFPKLFFLHPETTLIVLAEHEWYESDEHVI